MSLQYRLKINDPHTHWVNVTITGKRDPNSEILEIFIPSWCPGSYLMREYGRQMRSLRTTNPTGEIIHFKQLDKSCWQLDWEQSDLKGDQESFEISYEMYCHELTVRTSHVDASHAFIHGPSVFAGIEGMLDRPLELEIDFPPLWTKVSTGLREISDKREEFRYRAENYDQLLDCPIEIGCHDTDGFVFRGKNHELANFTQFAFPSHFKNDFQTIVETVSKVFEGDLPYDRYLFLSHIVEGKFGGLEHSNSTALQFCPYEIQSREGYIKWLSLVAHEYFHTWNVKRIRPVELGPFDYRKENYTRMHWLTEGLTSFMDEVFVFRAGLCTLEEYLGWQKANINRYLSTPGRFFDSLEDSSFNAWVKLYRPHENSLNSSVSYYLKGGIAFWILNALLDEKGKNIDDLLTLLWNAYRERPSQGLNEGEVFAMIGGIGGDELLEKFRTMIETTQELEIEEAFNKIGLSFEREETRPFEFGFNANFEGERVFVSSVPMNSGAHRGGINAGDEILAIDGIRLTKKNFNNAGKWLKGDRSYSVLVSRLGNISELSFLPERKPALLKEIVISDRKKAEKALKGRSFV